MIIPIITTNPTVAWAEPAENSAHHLMLHRDGSTHRVLTPGTPMKNIQFTGEYVTYNPVRSGQEVTIHAATVQLTTSQPQPQPRPEPVVSQASLQMVSGAPVKSHVVSGDRVLYLLADGTNLVLKDLASGTERTFDAPPRVYEDTLTMAGNHAAYMAQTGDREFSLFLHDLATGKREAVVKSALFPSQPILAGGKLVWVGNSSGTERIVYLHEIVSGQQKELVRLDPVKLGEQAGAFGPTFPIHFDGRYLVWAERVNSSTMVALDTQTGAQHKLQRDQNEGIFRVQGVANGQISYLLHDRSPANEYQSNARVWEPATGADRLLRTTVITFVQLDPPNGPTVRKTDIEAATIGGGTVAWLELLRPDGTNVFAADVLGQRLAQLTTDGGRKTSLKVGANYAVYQVLDEQGKVQKLMAAPLSPLPDSVLLSMPKEGTANHFNDLPAGHWASQPILRVAGAKLVTGYPDGSFQPDAPIRRAEFLAVLIRAYPRTGPQGTAFADVPRSHWAYSLIHQARGLGLVTGNQNSFYPDDFITRAEMAVLIQRVLKLPPADGPGRFADVSAQYKWARLSVHTLTAYGLLSGFPDGSFQPAETASRAQAAVILSRLSMH